jgi:hypothetical protein
MPHAQNRADARAWCACGFDCYRDFDFSHDGFRTWLRIPFPTLCGDKESSGEQSSQGVVTSQGQQYNTPRRRLEQAKKDNVLTF